MEAAAIGGRRGAARGACPRASGAIALALTLAVAVLIPGAATAAPVRTETGEAGLGSGRSIAREPTSVAFWAGEAVPGTDWHEPATYWKRRDTHLYTPALWQVLRRYRIPLYFNLRYRRDFGPVPAGEPQRHDALKIIRTANRLGVPVWGWVLTPYSTGYWAWEGDAGVQLKAVRSLVHWAQQKRVRLAGVALDPEPRLLTPFETTAAIMGGAGGASLSTVFAPTIDPAGQCAAIRTYSRIPAWVHGQGLPVAAAPMPAALDDLRDHRLALQDATGFVLPSAPWDELFFQAYRSVFSYYSGHDPGSGIVASYYRSAQAEFGSTGQISIGSTGRGPYRRFGPLLRDVRLAATLGARQVPIYSLERTLRSYGGPAAVAQLARAAEHPFRGPEAGKSTAPTADARALRGSVRRADRWATAITRGASLKPNSWPSDC